MGTDCNLSVPEQLSMWQVLRWLLQAAQMHQVLEQVLRWPLLLRMPVSQLSEVAAWWR